MRSFELFARWVMPRFHGQIAPLAASQKWAKDNRQTIFAPVSAAVKKAYTDAGHSVPVDYQARLLGARDVKDET